jgi:hypothetical protein
MVVLVGALIANVLLFFSVLLGFLCGALFFSQAPLGFLFCRSMAGMKQTMRAVDEAEAAAGKVSFDFWVSRVTPKDLEDYAKYRWFLKGLPGIVTERLFLDLGMTRLLSLSSFLCWFKVPAPPACHRGLEEI